MVGQLTKMKISQQIESFSLCPIGSPFQSRQNAQPVQIAILDDRGTIISTNQEWQDFFKTRGFLPGCIRSGKMLSDGCDQTHLIDSPNSSELAAAFRQVLSGEKDQLSVRLMCPIAGEQDLFICHLSRIAVNGKPYVVIARIDVSAQVEAEISLKCQSSALNAVANAILVTDSAGTIIWANTAFEKLTGYRLNEAVGKNPNQLLRSGKQNKKYYQKMWNTILSGKVWQGQLINRRKDGSLYWEEMTITPLKQNGYVISHFIAIKQDITERIRRERERDAIATLAKALRNVRTRAETIEIVLDLLVDLLEMDGVYFVSTKGVGRENRVEFSAGSAGQLFKEASFHSGAGVVGYVISTGQAYLSNDLRKDGLFLHTDILPKNVNTVACVPLINENAIIGAVLGLRQSPISSGEMKLLAAFAEMAGGAIHRADLLERTQHQLDRVSVLREIDKTIIRHLDPKITLAAITDQIISRLKVDAAAIAMIDPETGWLEYVEERGFATEYAQFAQSKQELLPGSRAVSENHTISLIKAVTPAISPDIAALWERERFSKAYYIPLVLNEQVKGVVEIYHRATPPDELEWINFLETLAGQAMIAFEDARMYAEVRRAHQELLSAYETTIEGWSRAMDLRDRETEGHTRRVTELTLKLARRFGIPKEELVNVRRGALLHDIGKLGVPDEILRKEGPLTDEEWILMRKHPEFAREMLLPINYLQPAMDIPYCHHEKWDGTGYPRKFQGEEIPLAARIFAVADVWDALTSDRPYRSAWTREKALEYIRVQSGKHFDPRIVKIFLEIINGQDALGTEEIQ